MTIFKNNEKPNMEDVVERLDRLEKRMAFLVVPCITTLLDETVFGYRRGLGGHPLIFWITRKLSERDLTEEMRSFLAGLLEKMDFFPHKTLQK